MPTTRKTTAAPQEPATPAPPAQDLSPGTPPPSPPPAAPSDPLAHVLANVFSANQSAVFQLAFAAAGIEEIDDLLSLSPQDVRNISWADASGGVVSLKLAQANTLISLIQWYGAQGTTDVDVFFDLDKAGLSTFRRELSASASVSVPATPASAHMSPLRSPPTPDPSTDPSAAPPAAPSAAPSTGLSPADEITARIKRDVSSYSTFKDRRQWSQWHRSFLALASSHGLSDVLDPDYSPSTESERLLFAHLQKFTFAVLTTHIRESEASEVLRKYSSKNAEPSHYTTTPN